MSDTTDTDFQYDSVDDAVQALRAGRLVIVVDDADRENEGDIIGAAECMTAEQVSLMLRRGAGVLCVALTTEWAGRLRLSPLVDSTTNTSPFGTYFLTPVDHVDAGTGVSAQNRTKTIRALADPTARHDDFVRPGHIQTLLADVGGVLRRAGHTEATTDLVTMAGRNPVGVLIEVLSERSPGMADRHELAELARQYEMPIVTIESLVRYRRAASSSDFRS